MRQIQEQRGECTSIIQALKTCRRRRIYVFQETRPQLAPRTWNLFESSGKIIITLSQKILTNYQLLAGVRQLEQMWWTQFIVEDRFDMLVTHCDRQTIRWRLTWAGTSRVTRFWKNVPDCTECWTVSHKNIRIIPCAADYLSGSSFSCCFFQGLKCTNQLLNLWSFANLEPVSFLCVCCVTWFSSNMKSLPVWDHTAPPQPGCCCKPVLGGAMALFLCSVQCGVFFASPFCFFKSAPVFFLSFFLLNHVPNLCCWVFLLEQVHGSHSPRGHSSLSEVMWPCYTSDFHLFSPNSRHVTRRHGGIQESVT